MDIDYLLTRVQTCIVSLAHNDEYFQFLLFLTPHQLSKIPKNGFAIVLLPRSKPHLKTLLNVIIKFRQ